MAKPCWQHQLVLVPALSEQCCFGLLAAPSLSSCLPRGLAVVSSTVGTALPIPNPNHGAAGCSGKHLVRAAFVSQHDLLTVSTLKQ